MQNKPLGSLGLLRRLSTSVLLLLAIFTQACDPSIGTPTPLAYEVDPLFREFYNHLGGVDILGEAISPLKQEGQYRSQYVMAGKMDYDPNAAISQRFQLSPLGSEMGLVEPPVPQPSQPGERYVGGHVIYPDFLPLYERIGGRYAGRPLTEVRYNPVRRRYEQYFESVGFYRLEGVSQDDVGLLAYGLWACGKECRELDPGDAIIDIKSRADPLFEYFVYEHGADFTGFALTDVYIGRDGRWEQVFERVVLAADTNAPSGVSLRPFSEALNILPEAPRGPSGHPSMYFYAVDGNTGYDVPVPFWNYITEHGGLELFGPPITHLSQVDEETYNQCFVNLCLIYDLKSSEGARIRPDALGYMYPGLYSGSDSESVPTNVDRLEPTLMVWESYPVVNTEQEQEIGVAVLENNVPVGNYKPILTITMPDGSLPSFLFPPMSGDGLSRLRLPPLKALNGTLIPYQVCTNSAGERKSCVKDSYIIWNNP